MIRLIRVEALQSFFIGQVVPVLRAWHSLSQDFGDILPADFQPAASPHDESGGVIDTDPVLRLIFEPSNLGSIGWMHLIRATFSRNACRSIAVSMARELNGCVTRLNLARTSRSWMNGKSSMTFMGRSELLCMMSRANFSSLSSNAWIMWLCSSTEVWAGTNEVWENRYFNRLACIVNSSVNWIGFGLC